MYVYISVVYVVPNLYKPHKVKVSEKSKLVGVGII